jgi:hypothetical protein
VSGVVGKKSKDNCSVVITGATVTGAAAIVVTPDGSVTVAAGKVVVTPGIVTVWTGMLVIAVVIKVIGGRV